MNKPTDLLIIKALKDEDCGLTAKEISEFAGVEPTPENLQTITDKCRGFVNDGELIFRNVLGSSPRLLFTIS